MSVMLIQRDSQGNTVVVSQFRSDYEAYVALPLPQGRVDVVRRDGRPDWTFEQWLEWIREEDRSYLPEAQEGAWPDKIARLQTQYGAYATTRPASYTARANTYAAVEVPAVKGRGSRVIGWGHDASRSDAYHAAWRDAVEWAEKHGWPAVLPEQ